MPFVKEISFDSKGRNRATAKTRIVQAWQCRAINVS